MFHRQFFQQAHNYLKNKGSRICFLEDGNYTIPSQFEEMVNNNSHLQFVKYKWLDKRYFIILVEKRE